MIPVLPFTLFSKTDVDLFFAGRHYRLFEKFGSHLVTNQGLAGCYFAVWAPKAQRVSVCGDFNQWSQITHPLQLRTDHSGIWEGFIPNLTAGMLYKYAIIGAEGQVIEKGDPYAKAWERPPQTASIIWESKFKWKDDKWLINRPEFQKQSNPVSVYEMHLGSWRRKSSEAEAYMGYRAIAAELVPYLVDMGFTHVEFMPVMEHPYSPSWGYQIHGYFAPTARFGNPDDFKYLIDQLHQAGIGVILDWVPSHFPADAHGLYQFDGTPLYEHFDTRKGYHPDWDSWIFNYGRNEVKSFLISNAVYWMDHFHADGLRVDAVASMIYLDYSRQDGQWVPNRFGGNENLDAIAFLREMNEYIHASYPGGLTIAEESTAYPLITHPIENGGLGFDLKWMMGWMNDTLAYFKNDPFFRSKQQSSITFSMSYAFSERFILPLSHDEVVHLKGSMLRKMSGDTLQAFANLRALYTYMYAHPGAKMLFMGCEIASPNEWAFEGSLPWGILGHPLHLGMQSLVRDLNFLFRSELALHECNYDHRGFEWIDGTDDRNSVLVFCRKSLDEQEVIIVVCHFAYQLLENYLIGANRPGQWTEIFNSDAKKYTGYGLDNPGVLKTRKIKTHNQANSLQLRLAPLCVSMYKWTPARKTKSTSPGK
ncbi:MAG: 1,4-alpha-glucan branching protein GlgB [Saprospiraceae bacterium]